MKKILRHRIEIVKNNNIYVFVWKVKNLTDQPFIFKRGIALLDEKRNSSHPRFIPLAFSEETTILPNKEVTVLFDELVKDKVTNYRFWLANYPRIGIEENTTIRYWISVSQFKNIVKKLDKLAIDLGLNPKIEEGLYVDMAVTNKQIDQVIAGNGTESIMSIEYHEGFVEGGGSIDDIEQIVNK